MLRLQNGLCVICLIPQETDLVVDHDHATGKVRGLLCSKCNKALGLFLDHHEVCLRASNYLLNPTVR